MDDIHEIASLLAGMESGETVENFLREILTPSELKDIALRWALMKRLANGHSQREIASELGISLCKITRGARILKDEKSVSRSVLVK
ncbi:MAG: Trp family transcriptional regulator [Spirochaetota bacterium]